MLTIMGVAALGFLPGTGGWELVIIAVLIIILLIKGPEHIPQLARALGKARGEYERGKREFTDEFRKGEERSKLEKAARDLGIDSTGKSDAELKRAIAASVSEEE